MAKEADRHTRRGFDLAGRKAYHSARAEFIRALRIVAQGLDVEHKTRVHSLALSTGLTALDEAGDFVPKGSALEGDLDLRAIIRGHKTRCLKLVDHRCLTSLQAVQMYVDYARAQFAIASGSEVAGSIALHALGKLHRTTADAQGENQPIAATKALACFQASIQVCPQNYLAFNDLGVLLAHGGRHADARMAFERSLMLSPSPTTLANLAQVYRQLGDARGAELAERKAREMLAAHGRPRSEPSRPAPSVRWVSPGEFARSYAKVAGPWQPAPVKRDGLQATPTPNKPAAPAIPTRQASRGWPWDSFKKNRQ
jgi:tetratricopeptide (TPR) repeat protein